MKVIVFTEFGKNYESIANITVPLFEEYCKRHKYVFAPLYLIDGNDYAFKKHEWIKELFNLEYDLIWYLDCDAIITNLNYRVEDFIDKKHSFFITKDFNELNGGSIIIKNDKFGKWFNNAILNLRHDFKNEQNCINSFFKYKKVAKFIKVLPHPSINSYQYHLYPECKEYVGREDLGDWKEGHFVLHTPGLPYEKRLEVLSQAKIVK